jgi:ABC-type transport system involved in multi-copper enzyme maturation permease subunit
MKIFNLIFALLFLSFAALQYNDPDPLLWILIYGAMVVLCGLAFTGRIFKKALLALAAGYVVYAIILFPSVMEWLQSEDRSMLFDELAKMQNLYIEETREFLGLMICLMVLLTNYLFGTRQIKAN